MFKSLGDYILNDTVLLYLGSKADERLFDDIERLKIQLLKAVNPRYVTAEFSLDKSGGEIKLSSTNLNLSGESIKALLAHSNACILLAATLGASADMLINTTQKRSIHDGVVIDAIANVAIEAVCDLVQRELVQQKRKSNQSLTMRYSPGYGDLPLEIQPELLSVLSAGKTIGLHTNSSNMLTPLKSVTAIWGIKEIGVAENYNHCKYCLLRRDCDLRKAGKRCGFN